MSGEIILKLAPGIIIVSLILGSIFLMLMHDIIHSWINMKGRSK